MYRIKFQTFKFNAPDVWGSVSSKKPSGTTKGEATRSGGVRILALITEFITKTPLTVSKTLK